MEEKLKTILVKGSEYVEVKERVRVFRKMYKNDLSIITTIVSNEGNMCLFKAEIKDATDRVIATGHAFEIAGSSPVNKTSHIENAETSAIGRALANLGIGIESSYASAEEVISGNIAINKVDKSNYTEASNQNIDTIPTHVLTKVSLKLEGSESIEDLNEAYKECKGDITRYPSLKAMFTARKAQLSQDG